MPTATQPVTGATIGTSHTVSRVFDAPRDLVWKANTEPERMAKWFSPKGTTSETKQQDFRVGGGYHYCQRSPDGTEMWGKIRYEEIDPIERLVYIQWFSDADGGITRHPLSPTWPREMHSVLAFEDLGNNQTRLSVTWTPYNATAEEQATFDGARGGVTGGWNGTFDKLAEYLASEQR